MSLFSLGPKKPRKHNHPSALGLFARFAGAGLLALVLISFVLFEVWKNTFEQQLLYETKNTTAKSVNALVGHMLTEEDLRGVKKGALWKSFEKKISALFELPEVVRVKIYDSQGDLIWSDAIDLMENLPAAENNPDLLRALQGQVEAELSSLQKEEHRFERGQFRNLMELYVPIYLEQKNKPSAVAEVYLNIDPLYATIRDTRLLIAFTIFGGLTILLAFTYIGLGRAVILIRRQNQELQSSLEQIFTANREKDALVTHLRDEVRNPEAVMSYAGLLLDGAFKDLPDNLKPPVDKIRNTAAEILSHFSRMLELVRLKVGDISAKKEPVDLIQLLRDVTNDLGIFCGDGTVALTLETPPDQVTISSDRALLQKVIYNLVTNAIKCTAKGRILVALQEDTEQKIVKIMVEDTGVGIKEEHLPRIFEEFYCHNDPSVRYKSGVGLGLPIVKKSVELLRGEIKVESDYGTGSKFTVTLPKEE